MKKYLLPVIALFFITTSLCGAQNATLWGVAQFGGATTNGVILNYDITNSTENDIYNFGNSPDAQGPVANLIKAKNGLLYGITISGGTNTDGAIFSYNMSTGTETVLWSFGSGTDGKNPNCSLLQASDSLLYGTTTAGGVNGDGIIFSYNIKTGVEIDLYNFADNNSDGGRPSCTLMQASNGLLYGLASSGGTNVNNGYSGTLFKYNIKTGVESTVHSFGIGTDGAEPTGTLIQATNGLLYGITQTGGIYGRPNAWGTIFSCDTNGVETDLHDFDSVDGRDPYEGLIQLNDSMMYGMTYYGGIYGVAGRGTGDGVLYSFNINSHIETVLHDFGSGSDGTLPRGRLFLASNGLLYGMTAGGGSSSAGTIFSYKISSSTETVLHSFPYLSATDGMSPTGGFIEIDSSTFQVAPTASAFCQGDSVTLIASGATTYTWAPAAGLSATTGDSVIANPTVTTTYTITGNGVSTITAVVTVNPNPTISLGAPPSVCHGDSATLTANGGTTYTWSPSTGLNVTTGSSVVATPSVTTTYTVTGTGALGCTATDTEKVTIFPAPIAPTFTQNVDTLKSSAQYQNQWYLNGEPLTGDTSQYLVITVGGEYKVSVTNEANGCSSASDSLDITTGINQLSAISDQLSIYPNPFNNTIVIKINSSAQDVKDWNLQIIDVLGRTIYSQSSLNYSNAIDLSNLASGIYFITVINKTGRAAVPIVKQN